MRPELVLKESPGRDTNGRKAGFQGKNRHSETLREQLTDEMPQEVPGGRYTWKMLGHTDCFTSGLVRAFSTVVMNIAYLYKHICRPERVFHGVIF